MPQGQGRWWGWSTGGRGGLEPGLLPGLLSLNVLRTNALGAPGAHGGGAPQWDCHQVPVPVLQPMAGSDPWWWPACRCSPPRVRPSLALGCWGRDVRGAGCWGADAGGRREGGRMRGPGCWDAGSVCGGPGCGVRDAGGRMRGGGADEGGGPLVWGWGGGSGWCGGSLRGKRPCVGGSPRDWCPLPAPAAPRNRVDMQTEEWLQGSEFQRPVWPALCPPVSRVP